MSWHVVPWYNSEEWNQVYEELSNLSSKKENALNALLIWKARCPSLPSGIESTLSLLQVHFEDTKQDENLSDDRLLRLAYSSAIMRFVNHMFDTETIKGSSLYQAAKNLGVPDWIVDLRHDTAHSNNLPHIALLREACAISLQWLQQNYWDKFKPNVQDCITSKKDVLCKNQSNITALMNLCTTLSICAHRNCKIRNLSEIPSMDTRESIMNDIKDLFADQIDLSNLRTVSIMSIFNIMNKQNKNLSKLPFIFTHVNEAILGEDSLFLSKDLLYFFSSNDYKKNRLNNSYVQCFELLLTFLHTNDLLLEFVLALINITQSTESQHFRARLSALWVSEILLALKRSQEFSHKLKIMTIESNQSKQKLKQLYHHWFPSTKGKHLMLDLQKPVPEQLLYINFIQPIIAAYNPYLIYFIRNLLNLLKPSIPTSVAERVYKLAELISTPEKFLLTASTIYTVDDLKTSGENDYHNGNEDVELTVVVQPDQVDIVEQKYENQVQNVTGIWRLASKNHNWSSCPIGQLPWLQNSVEITMETNHD